MDLGQSASLGLAFSMANEAFATQINSTSVAQVARFSMEGTSFKQEGGALLRLSQAFCGLVSSLVNSLEAFQDVGNVLNLETAAGIVNDLDDPRSSVCADATP